MIWVFLVSKTFSVTLELQTFAVQIVYLFLSAVSAFSHIPDYWNVVCH